MLLIAKHTSIKLNADIVFQSSCACSWWQNSVIWDTSVQSWTFCLGKMISFKLLVHRLITSAVRIKHQACRNASLSKFLSQLFLMAGSRPKVSASDAPCWLSVIVWATERHAEDFLSFLASLKNQDVRGIELIVLTDAGSMRWAEAATEEAGLKGHARLLNGIGPAGEREGFGVANGIYVAFARPGSRISPHGLKLVRRALHDHPDAKLLYTDVVIVDRRDKPVTLCMKPAFDPILLDEIDYISDFAIYRRSSLASNILDAEATLPISSHDLLKCYLQEIDGRTVFHLPYPAISNREDTLVLRRDVDTPRDTAPGGQWPPVTIIIPSKNALHHIDRTL
ncbi:MAG: hypothetical protein EP348_08195, partial [Alphaproteobacteria bacterium]